MNVLLLLIIKSFYRMFWLLVAFLFFKQVSSVPNTPPTNDQMIPAQRGGNVTLLCDVPNNEPVIIVEVIKRGETYSVLFWRNGTAVRDFQLLSFLGRVELLVENSIVKVIINNLTVNDPGDYKCKASSSIADHPARNITFDKWPGKTFTLIVSDQYIPSLPGGTVNLTCEVPENVSPDDVKWHQDGLEDLSVRESVDLQRSNNTVSLILNNVKPKDTGYYKCCINNSCNDPIKTAYVNVSDLNIKNVVIAVVAAVGILLVVGLPIIWWRCRKNGASCGARQHNPVPLGDEDENL